MEHIGSSAAYTTTIAIIIPILNFPRNEEIESTHHKIMKNPI